MGTLRIHLFGNIRLQHDEHPAPDGITDTLTKLLVYLLHEPRKIHRREVVAGVFWGDRKESLARRCLNTALWRLRAILEPGGIARGTYLISNRSGDVGFNWSSDHWLDVAAFESTARLVLSKSMDSMQAIDSSRLSEVVDFCNGDYLSGFFDDWALVEQARMRELYLRCLRRLMRYHGEQGHYAESIAFGQRLLACDPFREDICREMMRLYWDSGQRTMAMRQYHECHHLLASELNIEPMPETQLLYASIAFSPSAASPTGKERPSFPSMVSEERKLRHAINLLEEIADHSARTNLRLNQAIAALRQHLNDKPSAGTHGQ